MKAIFKRAEVRPRVKNCTTNQGPPLKKLTLFLVLFISSILSLPAFAQKQVTGTVVDKQKLPLPGATVKIKGTTTAVASDMNGKFTISVPGDNAVLTVSSIGFTSKDVPVGAQNNLSVTLIEESRGLNTVVVVGYGAQKKGEITSATGHADSSDFRQSGSRNALDLVQGKIAGLQITRAGGSNPNSGVNIQLRGVTSINAPQTPLIVIDGIPGGNLDLLQQDDIESIDVLKDGSGAAIYGTNASAGVILVTTKKGKAGPPQFSYSSYLRKEYLARIPKFLNADEFRQKLASGEIKGTDYGNSNDFFDQLVNHGNLSQNHNLALQGGTDKSNYRASLNYRNLDGFAKENTRTEYTIRLSLNQKGFNNRLNTQVNLATNFNRANLLGGGGWEDQLMRNPTLSNYNPDGTWYFENTSTNQLARLSQETNKRQQQTTSADAKAEFEFIKGLTGAAFISYQRNSYVDGIYRTLASEFSLENDVFKNGGYAQRSTFLEQNLAFEPTINYTRSFGDHSLKGVAGYSYRYNQTENFSAFNYGFLNDNFEENNLGAGNQLAAGKAGMSSNKESDKLIAFFGRVNYSYKDKYLLQFILRREGSTKFGRLNKWGNFPAVSAGWAISQESFMENVKFVNYLKLRAGYGQTGNSGVNRYTSDVYLGTGGVYLYPDGQYRETYGPNNNPNPYLRFERKKELNIGADFTLFNNRLSGSLDLFNRVTDGLLDTYTTPQPPYVRSSIYANIGQMSAKGVELALSFAAVKYKDFSWNIDATASTTRNKLDKYSDDIFAIDYRSFGDIGGYGALGQAIRTYAGGAIGEFWGKKFAGFTEDGKWLFYNRNGEKVRNDQINNSFDKNVTDYQKLGNGIPKYYASLTNTFKYKGFDMRIFMRGKFDYKILNTTAISYGNKVTGSNLLSDAFTKYAEINDTYMYSDYYLENGSYLKIDEVTLGYTFKLKSKQIRSLRAYLTGQNLVTFTSYSGNDPDFVSDAGTGPSIDARGPYPSTRSFILGVNFGF
ncbi:SusC/RagA family TonB-linked outer membrane protein [Mucilaginibacter defluvii]|uniref:TonB-dependent receptor n=1 Tax=Mucilaginibacter defluvii TaxID=1196019 RepID=A0ABP9G1Q4_9SPHI